LIVSHLVVKILLAMREISIDTPIDQRHNWHAHRSMGAP
jgi:hypothetical protein